MEFRRQSVIDIGMLGMKKTEEDDIQKSPEMYRAMNNCDIRMKTF